MLRFVFASHVHLLDQVLVSRELKLTRVVFYLMNRIKNNMCVFFYKLILYLVTMNYISFPPTLNSNVETPKLNYVCIWN